MEKLTAEEAKKRVENIKSIADDDECAHSWEDNLRSYFIKCLADGLYKNHSEIRELAEIVYSTNEIEFARWCA